MSDVVEALCKNLQIACDLVEAGVYFEEGGCYGMAVALHNVLCAAGLEVRLAVRGDFDHAFVVVGEDHIDYQGRAWSREYPFKEMAPAEFLAGVAESGHSEHDLLNAVDYARSAIDVAFAMAERDAAITVSAMCDDSPDEPSAAARLRP
jgi:hypothetical protein